MRRILLAGDHFVLPGLFRAALDEGGGASDLELRDMTLPWPIEPFGDVENVQEASDVVDELIAALDGVEIALTQLAPFTQRVFETRPELGFIGVCRGGPVNVDLEAATRAGVIVSSAPGRNAQAAAEYTIGLMLAAMRRIAAADAELHAGTWRGDYYTFANAGLEFGASTVGLIGLGAIGRIVARILRAFGAVVLVYDPYANRDDLDAVGARAVELDELLAASQVVSIHARLTAETFHLLNAGNLLLLPEGAVLVNSARGALLDYEPLPGLLRSGRLGALALDVYDIEPPGPDWPLLTAPNVVLSPHLAGATRETAIRAARITATSAIQYLNGERPDHVANPEVYERTSLGAP